MKMFARSLALVAVAFLMMPLNAATYTCEAEEGEQCTTTNIDTGDVEHFESGEQFVHSAGNFRLSNNWSGPQ